MRQIEQAKIHKTIVEISIEEENFIKELQRKMEEDILNVKGMTMDSKTLDKLYDILDRIIIQR